MTGERDERLVVQGRGPQGNQGNQGNEGNPGGPGDRAGQGGPGGQGGQGGRGGQGGQGDRGDQGGQGEKGDRGEQGEPGAAGLSRPVRRALVYMFAFAVVLSALSLFWINHAVHASQVAIQAAQRREQVMQQRQGAAIEEKLCITFGRLAALKPPAGDPTKNPSRAYEDELHVTLDELGTDLGCK